MTPLLAWEAVVPPGDSETAGPIACPPCRGTGQVVSNLGGEPSTMACPWCGGTGTFIAEHDAQAARREHGASGQPSSG